MNNTFNFATNTFLEKAELSQMQSFWGNTSQFDNLFFAVTSGSGGVVQTSPSDSNFFTTIDVPTQNLICSGGKYLDKTSKTFVTLPSATFIRPAGIVSINQTLGFKIVNRNWETTQLTGTSQTLQATNGTTFPIELLRGVENNIPVYLKLVRVSRPTPTNNNALPYSTVTDLNVIVEIATVVNELGLYINEYQGSVASITDWTDVRMVILGTKPIGIEFSADQLNGLYSYIDTEYGISNPSTPDIIPIWQVAVSATQWVVGSDLRNFWNFQLNNKFVSEGNINDNSIGTNQIIPNAVTVDRLSVDLKPVSSSLTDAYLSPSDQLNIITDGVLTFNGGTNQWTLKKVVVPNTSTIGIAVFGTAISGLNYPQDLYLRIRSDGNLPTPNDTRIVCQYVRGGTTLVEQVRMPGLKSQYDTLIVHLTKQYDAPSNRIEYSAVGFATDYIRVPYN